MNSKQYINIILFLCLILAGSSKAAGEVSVSSHLDKSEITIGDIVIYTIEVRHPEGYKIDAPPLGAQLGQFLIRDFDRPEQVNEDGQILDTINYKITTYMTGKTTIPSVALHWESPSGEKGEVSVPELEINVKSVSSKEALTIKGLKEPLDVPVKMWPYYVAGAGAVVAAILIVWLAWYLHRRRNRPAKELEALPLSPKELALQALGALDENTDLKNYYSVISEALRQYLEGRFGMDALERTTEEIEAALKVSDIMNREVKTDLLELLVQADFVKFAKFKPDQNRMRGDLQIAVSIIERTSIETNENDVNDDDLEDTAA